MLWLMVLTQVIYAVALIMSPLTWLYRRVKVLLTLTGLGEQQKELLKELNQYHQTLLQGRSEILQEDQELTGASFMGPHVGLGVAAYQLEKFRTRKVKIRALITKCRSAGISNFRIKLICREAAQLLAK